MDEILDLVRRTWGHRALRPLQRQAIDASLSGRDVLLVLPTGGGKSLCYQVPALLRPGLTVVVSPLIALMKDQVGSLLRRGIPAAFLNSSQGAEPRAEVERSVSEGRCRILYVAPERFGDAAFRTLLSRVRAFAIDEAHCVSQWGHDFREAYGRLSRLRPEFPGRPILALTASATPRVRDDLVRLLDLRDPLRLTGDFHRPNLRLRVEPRTDPLRDVLGVIRRRPGQQGLVYGIRRADVEDLALGLQEAGIDAVAYHAGLEEGEREAAQERWSAGGARVVVATVAFGMGIDRPDVRFVIHAAMPQSPEHYLQETGRAGRDGGEAECVLFWSRADAETWVSLIRAQASPAAGTKERLVREMRRYCVSRDCRHRFLVEYFGGTWAGGPCGACDACAGIPALPLDGPLSAEERGVYDVLKRCRAVVADSLRVAASTIATESALRELARRRPSTLDDLARVPGVGRRIRTWGKRFLEALRDAG